MIYGIGCDIVDIKRFEKYVDNKKRLEKLYTKNELDEFCKITNYRRKLEFLAGRFGKPYIEYKDFITHLTISHTDTTVVAFVILEKGGQSND